jgi:hypothetical protein
MRHGLAVVAFGLAVQLVEHVCHCDSTSVFVERCTDNKRGAVLIMGNCVAATSLLGGLGAESKTGWPIWRRAVGGGGDEG